MVGLVIGGRQIKGLSLLDDDSYHCWISYKDLVILGDTIGH